MPRTSHLLVGATSPVITGYSTPAGAATYTQDVTFEPQPDALYSMAYNSDASRLFVSSTTSGSGIDIYDRDGKNYAKTGNIPVSGAAVTDLVLTFDGLYLAAALSASPYLKIFKYEGTGWTDVSSSISTLPTTTLRKGSLKAARTKLVVYASTGQTGSSNSQIRSWTHDGTNWVGVGSGASSGATTITVSGSALNDTLVVASRAGDSSTRLQYYVMTASGAWTAGTFSGVSNVNADIAWMDVSPDGQYLTVSTAAGNARVYRIAGSSGSYSLTTVGTYAFSATLISFAYSEDGKFLFARSTNALTIYSVDQSTGALTLLSQQPEVQPGGTGNTGTLVVSPKLWDAAAVLYDGALLALMRTADLTQLKLLLLSEDAVFDAANTQVSQVTADGAYEVYGSGWDQGGVALADAAFAAEGDGVKLTVADVGVDIFGDALSAYAGLIVDASTSRPLMYLDIGAVMEVASGQRFTFDFSEDGIILIRPA